MSYSTLVTLAFAALVRQSIAGYALQDHFTPSNFFSEFTFFTAPDPTDGFVNYVDQSTAQSAGLISSSGSSVMMGVDSTNMAPNGRNSVRLTSNNVYNHGLILLDLQHMPEGCGTWPAFWMTGPDWPNEGEIDIIEGVNDQSTNTMTLHTGAGCSMSTASSLFSGTMGTSDCDVNASNQPMNAGCSISASSSSTYGSGLNAGNGGVYATEWTSNAISTWFFPRSAIPADITSGSPHPSGWGKPLSQFQGSTCDIDSSIKNQQIVFDTTLCGAWAGSVWGQSSSCASQAASCEDFVANNPSAFQDAYWEVNSLKVYTESGADPSSDPPPASAPPAASSIYPIVASPVTSAISIPAVTPTSFAKSSAAAISAWNGGEWAADAEVTGAATSAPPTPAPAPQTVTWAGPAAPPTPTAASWLPGAPIPSSWVEGAGMPEDDWKLRRRGHAQLHKRHFLGHAHKRHAF